MPKLNIDPTVARERAKKAARVSWDNTTDRTARTAKARAAREARFMEAAGGDPEKAAELRREYFAELSRKGSEARWRKTVSEAITEQRTETRRSSGAVVVDYTDEDRLADEIEARRTVEA